MIFNQIFALLFMLMANFWSPNWDFRGGGGGFFTFLRQKRDTVFVNKIILRNLSALGTTNSLEFFFNAFLFDFVDLIKSLIFITCWPFLGSKRRFLTLKLGSKTAILKDFRYVIFLGKLKITILLLGYLLVSSVRCQKYE